ncbi:hypothetical protein V6N11_045903 [Hibiscus sabdariffa]|uniref:Uncharacterized protein n=1 Tax=Hibiscus sabdariffa TaxID=183260 RepID=A0ABR2Q2S3_9ROSI
MLLEDDRNFIDTSISIYGEEDCVRWYYEFLDRTFLMEIQCKGGVYTWSNQRSDEAAILEKLDRALSSLDWNCLFPRAIAVIDVAIAL